MYKKIIIYSLVLFLLGIGLSYSYLKFGSLYKVYLGTSINNIPEADWDDVTSGKLGSYLNIYNRLNLFKPSSKYILPIEVYRHPNPFFYENHGFSYVELFLTELQSGIYLDLSKQPFRSFAVYRTKINNEHYYLLIQKWTNKDKSVTFVPAITSDITDYSSFINNSYDSFPSLIVKIKDKDTCNSIYNSGVEYCNWYFENVVKYDEIRTEWMTNNILPKEISKFPILLTKSPLKI